MFLTGFGLQAQQTNVFFVGNSYTAVNDLPQMTQDAALSAGDTLFCQSSAPGGYTLQMHCNYSPTLTQIYTGMYDFVVLQEQSQMPAFTDALVQTDVYPYARVLDSLITLARPCAETVFYRTWGRKNGDATNCAAWPPMCTYAGMDSMLALRYYAMAQSNQGIVSPVGAVWKQLRQTDPGIELYQSDESHPSVAGTYAAACTFYSVILRKDPLNITYNAGLDNFTALTIRQAASAVVFEHLSDWLVGSYDPVALFDTSLVQREVTFVNQSAHADDWLWQFGDGFSSTDPAPVHTYAQDGTYTVTLYASQCGMTDTFSMEITVADNAANLLAMSKAAFDLHPNPTNGLLHLKTDLTDYAVQLVDLNGKLIRDFSNLTGDQTLNLEQVQAGVYVLYLHSDLWGSIPQRLLISE